MTQLEIEAFLTVVRQGSITAAAQSLFITQPALSRRIRALEEELAYPLFKRGKGQRTIRLTEEGRAFVPVAEKWQDLWRESREIAEISHRRKLTVSAIGSVNTYLMSPVYRRFLQRFPQNSLAVTDQHSPVIYDLVAEGQADLGIISDDRFVQGVETIPLCKEKMVLVAEKGTDYPKDLGPDGLDPACELRLPWNPEYVRWHDYWFGSAQPRLFFDQMALLEDFIRDGGCWAILPATVAGPLLQKGRLEEYPLRQGPPDRIIYYLLGRRREEEQVVRFLALLKETLGENPWLELL